MYVHSDGGADPLDFSQGPWISMLQDLDMNGVYTYSVYTDHNYIYICV